MGFSTINPASGQINKTFEYESYDNIEKRIENSQIAFQKWREQDIDVRLKLFKSLATVLDENVEEYALIMTKEMGKVVSESRAEIKKCASMIGTYVENSKRWLTPESVKVDGYKHYISYESVGIILSVMPWNFPFWQVLRFAVPTMIAGNVSILKHSNIVPECALIIEDAFKKAGFPQNVFQTIITSHKEIARVVEHPLLRGISFTGSTSAGRKIAELGARNLKKVVLELGGSDPFIVLKDANMEKTVKGAVLGRVINAGQTCIASKRFIVHQDVAHEFIEKYSKAMKEVVAGDPLDSKSTIGPLVNMEAIQEIDRQVQDAISKGATIMCGGKPVLDGGRYYPATLITDITKDMKVWKEEVFGPIAPVVVVSSYDEAIEVANDTEFGLGGSVWGENLDDAEAVANRIECGSVFVNSIVKSDARMPFGGVKTSGIGRELSKYGLLEFCNIKGNNIYR